MVQWYILALFPELWLFLGNLRIDKQWAGAWEFRGLLQANMKTGQNAHYCSLLYSCRKGVFKSPFPLSCCEWEAGASTSIMSHHDLALVCGQLQSAKECVCQGNNYLLLKPIWMKRLTIHWVLRGLFSYQWVMQPLRHILAQRFDKV